MNSGLILTEVTMEEETDSTHARSWKSMPHTLRMLSIPQRLDKRVVGGWAAVATVISPWVF